MLLLPWLAPGGGRGIVALDLLNCTKANERQRWTVTHGYASACMLTGGVVGS
jgi:hypothetical protein